MTQASKKLISTSHTARAWIIWSLSAFFMFYKNALEISPSVMNNPLMKSFGISAVDLGNLAASYFYAYLLLQIPAGLLIDRIGPRKVTSIAIILCSVGSLIFASAESFTVAVAGRFMTGVGAAFAVVNCFKLIANWFPPKRIAIMVGLMMTVAMLGAVGGQAPLSALMDAFGWRQAINIIGFTGLLLACVFWLVVRDKAPNHQAEKNVTSEKFSLWGSLKKVLSSKQSWALSFYSGFAYAPVMIFGGLWGVSYIEEAFGLSKNIAAQSVSMIFIGFAFGAPIFGWCSDYLGKRKVVMFWGTLLALITISSVIYLPELSQFALTSLLFLFGFAISSFLLCFTMIREIHSIALAATSIGFMNAFDALFGAFSDPLAGKLLDATWDGRMADGARIFSASAYKLAFLIIPVYLCLALLSVLAIRDTRPRASSPPSTLP